MPTNRCIGYYTVEPDEVATIAILVDAMHHCERALPVLFRVGPTPHQRFAAA
jgi:hypothetical protein